MKRLSIFILLLALISLACASVYPLDFYSTVAGMRAAAAGKSGTAIYAGQNLYVMIWPHRGQYAFAVINQQGDVVDDLLRMVNANGVNVFRMSDLIKWMESNGFRQVDPKALPVNITTVLLSEMMAAVARGSRSLITPILIPADILDFDKPLPGFEEVQQ
jgi:hypothetical protein